MTHLDNSNNNPNINMKRLHHVCQCATSQQVTEGYPLKFLETPKAIPRNERANGLDCTPATTDDVHDTKHTRTGAFGLWSGGRRTLDIDTLPTLVLGISPPSHPLLSLSNPCTCPSVCLASCLARIPLLPVTHMRSRNI